MRNQRSGLEELLSNYNIRYKNKTPKSIRPAETPFRNTSSILNPSLPRYNQKSGLDERGPRKFIRTGYSNSFQVHKKFNSSSYNFHPSQSLGGQQANQILECKEINTINNKLSKMPKPRILKGTDGGVRDASYRMDGAYPDPLSHSSLNYFVVPTKGARRDQGRSTVSSSGLEDFESGVTRTAKGNSSKANGFVRGGLVVGKTSKGDLQQFMMLGEDMNRKIDDNLESMIYQQNT